MKKIVEFLKQPYTTTFLAVVGLTGGFFAGITVKNLIELQNSVNQKKAACQDAYSVICVQAHACTGNSVSDCDKLIEDEQMCSVDLPDLQTIYRCKQELRIIECTDNMPTSCSLFME